MNSNKSKSQSRSPEVELLTFAWNWNLDRIVIVKWHRQCFVKMHRRSHAVTRILGARKTHSDVPKNCTDVQNFLYFLLFFKVLLISHFTICKYVLWNFSINRKLSAFLFKCQMLNDFTERILVCAVTKYQRLYHYTSLRLQTYLTGWEKTKAMKIKKWDDFLKFVSFYEPLLRTKNSMLHQ